MSLTFEVTKDSRRIFVKHIPNVYEKIKAMSMGMDAFLKTTQGQNYFEIISNPNFKYEDANNVEYRVF